MSEALRREATDIIEGRANEEEARKGHQEMCILVEATQQEIETLTEEGQHDQ